MKALEPKTPENNTPEANDPEVFIKSAFDVSQNDVVNHPPHYEGKIECIDAMIQQFGVESVMQFCKCNAFKYLYRCEKKHSSPLEDIKKAEWYIKKYIELYEKVYYSEATDGAN